jgi:polyisoprenoid-binding protein YceI
MKMLLTRFALYSALVLICSARASANEVYRIDQAHSKIGFKVHQFLSVVRGRFTQFSGEIELDREHPEKSSVSATIQVKSIDTGIAKRDAHLCSPEFFNVAKFPEIKFQSRSVKQTGPDSADILGDFTMHGVTKPITLQVKLLGKAEPNVPTSRWQVTTDPLKRADFRLMWSPGLESVSMIGKDVTVNIEIQAARAKQ